MAVSSELKGPRLQYVLRKLPGTVTRTKYIPPAEHVKGSKASTANSTVIVIEDAGYMLFLPTGQCYRLTEAQATAGGYDSEPNIIGFDTANDKKTAAGRFKLANTEMARKRAYAELEKEVVDACLRRVGSIENAIAEYDPKGKVKDDRAA